MKEQILLSPKKLDKKLNRQSLAAGKVDHDDDADDGDTACSSTFSQLTNTTSDESVVVHNGIITYARSGKFREWNDSFQRALQRRAQLARERVPKTLYPFLDMLLKQPVKLLSTHYSLSISRVLLTLSSLALIAGRNKLAFVLCGIALCIFRQAKLISQCIFLNRWLWLSGSTMAVSFLSFLALALSTRQPKHKQDVSTYLWLGGYLLQKIWGGTLAYYMYRHLESWHFLELRMTILGGRNIASNSYTSGFSRRARTNPSVFELYHGATQLARTNDQEKKRFRFSVLSTSLEVYKEIDCHLLSPNGMSIIGIAKVTIPEMRNVKMVNSFDILDDDGNSRGQISVEIELRPQS